MLIYNTLSAQIASPVEYPAAGTSVNPGNEAWANPTRIFSDNNSDSTVSDLDNTEVSTSLAGTNYGFAIPGTATISGIVVEIERYANNATGVFDNAVRLVKGGTIQPENRAGAGAWGTGRTVITYGSPTDMWNNTWTPAQINAANFGAVIQARSTGNNRTASVDYIRITVYYYMPPTITGFAPVGYCQGTTPSVTINGTNFVNGNTAVSFNGVPAASVTFVSTTQVTATPATGLTSGNVSVNTPGGTTNGAFTLYSLPTVNAISGSPTTVCPGATVQFTDSTPGGVWSSTNTAVATVDATGLVTAVASGSTNIRYTVTNGNGCSAFATTGFSVYALPVLSGPTSVCPGGTIQLLPSSGGTWVSNNTAVATINAATGLVTGQTAGIVTFTFTSGTTNCSATTGNVTVHVLPSISSHPSPQSVCSGSSAVFSVAASGTGITYQWYNGATMLVNGGNISGATSANLTINPVAVGDASANYHCVVSGTCTPAAISNNAALTVTQRVTITAQPAVTQTQCAGTTAIFTVGATGDGLTYQWFNGATQLTDGGNISGATSQTLSLANISAADASTTYHCVVSGLSPCTPVASNNAILIVNQGPAITSGPAALQTVCAGTSVSFNVAVTGGDLIYQWYRGATMLVNGGPISGATTATLTINPTTPADSATDYYCIISNGCATPATSAMAQLVVNETPFIPTQTVSVCSEAAFDATPVNGVPTAATIVPANTIYSWSAPVVTGGITGGSAQSGQTSVSQILTNPTNTDQTATYTVTPTSGTTGNCVGAPFTVIVTVNPKPFIINMSLQACSGQTFSFTPANGGGNIIPAGTTYSWGVPSISGGMTGGTAQTAQLSFNQTLTNPTNAVQTATYNVTATSGSCLGSTFTVTLSVNPTPTVAGDIATQSVCSGDPISTITLTNPNNVPGVSSYNWTRDNGVNVTGMPMSGSGNTIAGSLVNTTGDPQTTIFTITAVSEEGCPSITQTVSVTVNPIPLPIGTPQTQTVCSGNLASISLSTSNSVTGATFSWTRDNLAGVTGLANSGTLPFISAIPINTTNVQQTVTFTVTAFANGCSSSVNNITIVVDPQPTVAATPASQTVCGQIAITPIALSNPNSVGGTTFSWTRDNTVAVTGIAASGTNATISGTLVNTTNTPQVVTFTITANANSCSSLTTTATVTVNPSPLITPSLASQSICTGAAMTPITFNNTNSVAGTTYTFTSSNANITGFSMSGNVISGTLANATSSPQTTTLTVTATAPSGCTSAATATVTVYRALTTPVIGNAQVVCANSTPTLLVMTTLPSGGSPSATYQWQSSTVSDTGPWTDIAVNGTNSTYQPPVTTAATPNTWYRIRVTNCNTVFSLPVLITVVNNQNFSFDLDFGGQTLCSGASFTAGIVSLFHNSSVYIRYTYTADPNYIVPATITVPVGNTGCLFGLCVSGAGMPMTVQNNTNAQVATTIYLTPHVYNSSTNVLICSLSPQSAVVNIRPRPTATVLSQPTDPICSGTSAGIVIDGNLTGQPMNFNWVRTDGNTNVVSSQSPGSVTGLNHPNNFFTIPDVLTNNSATVQSVTYQITPSSTSGTAPTSCPGTPITVTVSVNPQLTAGAMPANQTVCSGSNPSIIIPTGIAGGGTLTYQWQIANAAAGPWTDIGGATSASYDPPGPATAVRYYRLVITSVVNGVTCSVASSSVYAVFINTVSAGLISGNQTICYNTIPATTLGSTTPGSGAGTITYQWQSSTVDCTSGWGDILGATGTTYTIPSALTVTTFYRRITRSTLNSVVCEAFSGCVGVTVNNVTGGTIADDQVLCGNNPAAFTSVVAPTGSGTLSYQWQSTTAADCNSGWANISGANGLVYDAPSGLLVTTRYRRITTSTLNGVQCTAFSNCVTVTANSVTGGVIDGNRTVCMGGDPAAFTVSVPSVGTNIAYQWQSSPTGIPGSYTDILGATAATYDHPGPVNATIYFQRVTFSEISSVSCSAVSNFVTVFVNNATAPVMAGDQNMCAGENPNAFTITTPAVFLGTPSYQWYSSTVGCSGPWAPIPGATASTYDPPVIAVTTYYHVVATSTMNSVACTATSNCITVASNGKVWNGSAGVNWNNAANWTPAGVPTSSHCVVIPNVTNDPVISGSNYLAYALNLTILNGGNLSVDPSNTIQVTNFVNVNAGGVFFISDDASLVQIDNVANTGIVTVQRITPPVYRFDYTYWNSPVTFASNYTLGNLSPLTQPDKFYSWNPSVSGGNGNWIQESVATIMNPIKGYIVRAPNGYSSNPAITAPYTATFTGTPNNGDLQSPIQIGSLAPAVVNDKLNLIGNPYPSAIDADLFLAHPGNAALLDGTMYFWTHHSPPSVAYPDPFYGNFVSNYTASDYATYTTGMGGTSTVPSGYGGTAPNGYIATGQSFFIKATTTGNAVFNNSMRVTGQNNVFFKMTNPFTSATPAIEKHRIWLNLANAQGAFSQVLVGYAEGATNAKDRNYDGVTFASNAVSFYSLVDDFRLTIQGRALPFETTDVVPMGYKATIATSFTIGIDHLDGLFENQNVYIEDKLLNVIHDLKSAPYTFASAIGRFDDRFVLRYTNQQLGVGEQELGNVVAFISNAKLFAQSQDTIESIEIFDISGKRIVTFEPDSNLFEKPFPYSQGIYIAKVKMADGSFADIKLAN